MSICNVPVPGVSALSEPVEVAVEDRDRIPDRLRRVWRDLLEDPAGAVFALGVSGLLVLAIVGLPLAIAGVFRPFTVLPSAAIVWIIVVLATWGRGLGSFVVRGSRLTSVVALLAVIGFGGFAAMHSGQHVLTDRDPGIYVLSGRWLADNGTLIFDAGLPASVVEASGGHPGVTHGVYPRAGGEGTFQFAHTMAVILAVLQWIGGDGAMLRVPALIAALACLGVYVLARRLAGPVIGLIGFGTLLLHPVTLHFAKDVYSEFLAIAFLMAGLVLWMTAESTRSAVHWLLVGAMIGGATLARIDSWMTVVAFLVGVSYFVIWRRPGGATLRQTLVPLALGLAGVTALGLVDLLARSPLYLSALSDEAWPVIALSGLLMVATPVLGWAGQRWRRGGRERFNRYLAYSAGSVVALLGLFALFLRPRVRIVLGGQRDPGFGALQAKEGLEVDLFRTYAEQTMLWFTRYQGYLMVLLLLAAVVFATVMIVRAVDRLVPVVTTFLGVAVLYLWRPSITPDHFWAMRRFLPVVLPLGCVLLSWGIKKALDVTRHPRVVWTVVAAPLAAGVAMMIITGAPVATARTHIGVLDATRDVCASLPDNAVAVMDDDLGTTLLLAMRTICGVPTQVDDSAAAIKASQEAGFATTAVVAPSRCVGGVEIARIDRFYTVPESTLSQPPAGSEERLLSVSVKSIDAELTATTIPDDAIVGFEVMVTSSGQIRDSIVATLGTAESGLRLRLARDGSAEIIVDTSAGKLGVVISFFSIADGRPRILGGYLTGDTLYATCDGQVMAATTLPAAVTFAGSTLVLRPEPTSGFDRYEGDVIFVQQIVHSP